MNETNEKRITDESADISDCVTMARALRDMMTVANFSGLITQNSEKFRQFDSAVITEHADHATLRFDFDEKRYVVNVFCVTSEETRNENG